MVTPPRSRIVDAEPDASVTGPMFVNAVKALDETDWTHAVRLLQRARWAAPGSPVRGGGAGVPGSRRARGRVARVQCGPSGLA